MTDIRLEHSRNITRLTVVMMVLLPVLTLCCAIAWGAMVAVIVWCGAAMVMACTAQITEAIRESK